MAFTAIIDYNMGNLRSVHQAVKHVSAANDMVTITSDASTIIEADRVIFPGQGAARDCMQELTNHKIIDAIHHAIKNKPFLGICMGMQVLMRHSEENNGTPCLNLFDGNVKAFKKVLNQSNNSPHYKIPHMGWNQIKQVTDHPLWSGISSQARFYFVHSYYVTVADKTLVVGETDYGIQFTSCIAKDNVFTMQSHPEKSADDGLQLLKNFTQWNAN